MEDQSKDVDKSGKSSHNPLDELRQFWEQEKNAIRPSATILSITEDENVATCLQSGPSSDSRLMPRTQLVW